MVCPRCEANTDVTCFQMIAKKEVTAKNRGLARFQVIIQFLPPFKSYNDQYQ